ncbi:hypothetical protein BHE74_00042446 [Ensete ventricosum]|nr:hypothetical protein BHE74_00042446 [Ensete ventricosum]
MNSVHRYGSDSSSRNSSFTTKEFQHFTLLFGPAIKIEKRLRRLCLKARGCPKDDVVGGSKIDRVLVDCEKKNDKRYNSRIFRRKISAG